MRYCRWERFLHPRNCPIGCPKHYHAKTKNTSSGHHEMLKVTIQLINFTRQLIRITIKQFIYYSIDPSYYSIHPSVCSIDLSFCSTGQTISLSILYVANDQADLSLTIAVLVLFGDISFSHLCFYRSIYLINIIIFHLFIDLSV